jgi:hypothetical protein
MVKTELFVQFLLREIKYNPSWHLNALNKAQLTSQHTGKLFTKTPTNHDLAAKLYLKDQSVDYTIFYEPNYKYKEFILGKEFHCWANQQIDILKTKQVGKDLFIVTQCIPSEIILLPLIQLARRHNKRISPDMLVQHLTGEIDLLNQFLNH